MTVLYWTDSNPVSKSYLVNLQDRYGSLDGRELIEALAVKELPGRVALVSSFGTEAAVLLHKVSTIDKNLPVIFIDTGKLFEKTYQYRDQLVDLLGLTNVQTIKPSVLDIDREDKEGNLYKINPDTCCHIRKVKPLDKALEGYYGWISGRKRFHGGMRTNLPTIEISDGRIKINPLAMWPMKKIHDYYKEHNLPLHPLQEDGYLSVGCETCTAKPIAGQDSRSGRWAGQGKTECGIHLGADGKFHRGKKSA